jgi:4-hydroxybenzoate polyprenyltransferase
LAEEYLLKALVITMRPKQWTKQVFVFAAIVFDRKLTRPSALLSTIVAAIAFCLVSGAVYLINDLVDIEKDRQHPTKRKRPLPAGELNPMVAIVAAAVIPLLCIPAAILFHRAMGLVLLVYFVLQLFYSFFLKHMVIIDVMTIAAGFVLRVAAGVAVIDVERFSPWLYVCMTLLALFLGFGKRRHELFTLQANANNHRASLEHYSLELIDEMSVVVVSAAVMAYSLYTFSAPNLPRSDGQPLMMLTIPFVLYGLFRYQYLIHVKKEGGTPEELVLKDLPLIVDLLLYGVTVLVLMYGNRLIEMI